MVLTAHCSVKAASMKTVPTVGTVGKLYIPMTGGGSDGGDLLQHPHMDTLYLNRMVHPSCIFVSHFPISVPLYLLFPPCRMPSSRPEIIICRFQCKRKIFFRKQERLKVLKWKLFTFFCYFLCSLAGSVVLSDFSYKTQAQRLSRGWQQSTKLSAGPRVLQKSHARWVSPVLIHLGCSLSYPSKKTNQRLSLLGR